MLEGVSRCITVVCWDVESMYSVQIVDHHGGCVLVITIVWE